MDKQNTLCMSYYWLTLSCMEIWLRQIVRFHFSTWKMALLKEKQPHAHTQTQTQANLIELLLRPLVALHASALSIIICVKYVHLNVNAHIAHSL